MNYKEERPWGWFEILYEEENLKVKRILVKPQNRLSMQSHSSRSENWCVIAGSAFVQLDDQQVHLSTNQSIFIPALSKHRVENKEKEDLIFIEVQTGTYLGEDDIVRYEDDYDRT